MPGTLLGRDHLWFKSSKRPSLVSDQSLHFGWSLTGGRLFFSFPFSFGLLVKDITQWYIRWLVVQHSRKPG